MALLESPPTDLAQLLAELAGDDRLAHVEELPARPARFGQLARPLAPALMERLPVDGFWSHQAAAIDLARAGRSTVIATGTASGKSLCYQVPIAEAALTAAAADAPANGLRTLSSSRVATSLLIFPTKALAQDQLRALTNLAVPNLVPAVYDGDCGPEERSWARTNANAVLTNPEMLHHGLLPHHQRWAGFLARLRYVVIDELHVLRGVFGSHVAHLLRRLRRLAARYGADPTFIFSSATIGEPGRLASELCGLDVAEIIDDGSPRGPRWFVLWNPAAAPERAGHDTARLVARLVTRGHRTIAFTRSRKGTELVAADVRRRLAPELADQVRPYRGGYLAQERRAIEAELFGGGLRGVIATTALELGVDIGGLDACVLDGFPGTVASMWQQAGRAGREAQPSIVVLVAGDDQLDQWMVQHPTDLFRRAPEPAVINPANPNVLHAHLACAAYEHPLSRDDERWWPTLLDDGVRAMALTDRVRVRARRDGDGPLAVWAGRGWPSDRVGLRNGGSREVRIARDDGTLVGTVDRDRAGRLVHPGAVYLHQGRTYRVVELDLDYGAARVVPCNGDEWTRPRSTTDITILAEDAHRQVGQARLALGTVRVRSQVVGYQCFATFTGELLANEELHLPPSELTTRAVWYTVQPRCIAGAGVAPAAVPGTLHAVEHAAIGLLPLFTICDRWDVGGLSTPCQAETGLPTIVIYDGYPGGSGIAELGYASADRHLAATRELIDACPCDDGCPSCVQSPKCGNGNDPLDKAGASTLLAAVLGPRSTALAS